MFRPRAAVLLASLILALLGVGCEETPDATPAAGASPVVPSVWVAMGGETFTLELAADARTRQRGLSGRASIPRNGGMLFVYGRSAPLAMVMRDCAVPIDVAFLGAEGRIVSTAAMQPEAPRAPDESSAAYNRRLPVYRSGAPAQFAIEVAGGRLAELGVRPGAQIVLDTAALAAKAR